MLLKIKHIRHGGHLCTKIQFIFVTLNIIDGVVQPPKTTTELRAIFFVRLSVALSSAMDALLRGWRRSSPESDPSVRGSWQGPPGSQIKWWWSGRHPNPRKKGTRHPEGQILTKQHPFFCTWDAPPWGRELFCDRPTFSWRPLAS